MVMDLRRAVAHRCRGCWQYCQGKIIDAVHQGFAVR
jgi:Pyruvate/2-oxoacid:ferredoxin oxidoreductase delta subunit